MCDKQDSSERTLAATRPMILASADDAYPMLQLWDLRNQHAPLRELLAHSKLAAVRSSCYAGRQPKWRTA